MHDRLRSQRMLHRTRRRPSAVGALVVAVLALTGCGLGKRPHFDPTASATGAMTGDTAIDAVLTRLDRVSNAVFSADYSALLAFGSKRSTVKTTQSAPARRSTTIGNVRYITDDKGDRTCKLDAGTCVSGTNPALISDTGLGQPDFFFGDVAKRLRRDALALTKPAEPTTFKVGNYVATCAVVTVSGGSKTYCVFDNGVLARFLGADLTVELLVYRETVDEDLFTP